MNSNRLQTRSYQTGVVSIVVAIILFAVVIFWLQQTYGIISTTSQTNQVQDESVAAFFLAESGLERAKGLLEVPGSLTNTTCTDIAGGPLLLGRGSITSTATSCDNSTPPNCGSGSTCGSGSCGSCTVTVTGTSGNAVRTISRVFTYDQSTGGTFCNTLGGTVNCMNTPTVTWKSKVTNTSGKPAVALFHMAAILQSSWSAATCSPAECKVAWTTAASPGIGSVGSQGNAIALDLGQTVELYQTLNLNRNVVENGALFPGATFYDVTLAAGGYSYWDDTNGGGGDATVSKKNETTGATNDGTSGSLTCPQGPLGDEVVPGNTEGSGGKQLSQSCTSWCVDKDTLVMGISANATVDTDNFTSVVFHTAGTNPASIPLNLVSSRYPASGVVGAPPDVFSEIRYAHNPRLPSSNASVAVNSGAEIVGTAGAQMTASYLKNTLVLNVTGLPLGNKIYAGDTVTSGLGSFKPVIAGTPGTEIICSLPCTVPITTLDNNNVASGTVQLSSKYLVATGAPSYGTVSKTEHIFASSIDIATIAEPVPTFSPYIYTLSAPIYYPTTGTKFQTNGTRLSCSGACSNDTDAECVASPTSADCLPAADPMSSAIYLQVSSGGTGSLQGGTTTPLLSTSRSINGAVLSKPPIIPLVGATVKGGTYPFFDHSGAKTYFTVTRSSTNIEYWASGFLCLSGVSQTPTETTSGPATPKAGVWREVVN